MTAEVLLECNPDLTREVVIERSDVSHANHTYLRAGERVSIDDLLHLTLIASDNAAARALARTSEAWHRGLRRPHEREGEGAGAAADLLCGSVGPASPPTSRRPTTWRASSRLRRATSACRFDHADAVLHRDDEPPRHQHPQHEPARGEGRRGRAGGEDRFHHRSPGTAWPRCCACRSRVRRWRWSCSARGRMPAASWRRGTCSTGSARRAGELVTPAGRGPARKLTREWPNRSSALRRSSNSRIPVEWRPRRAAASRSCRRQAVPVVGHLSNRRPSDSGGTCCRRRCDSADPGS